MHYLCGKYNLTLLVYSVFFNRLMVVDDDHKELRGVLGLITNKLIEPNHRRLCKLIDQENVGSRLMNSSEYDGALGKLQRGEADVFMKGEWPILDDEAIGLTPVTNTEEYSILHSIDEKINSVKKDKLLFLASLDWKFMLFAAITKVAFILIATFVIFGFSQMTTDRWTRRLFRTARLVFGRTYGFNNGVKGLSLIAVILFGVVVFNFYVQQLLSINIKTSKVVIDTDSLITDRRSLFKSPRKIAWLGSERDRFIAKNSPKNTFLYKLYYLKNETPVRLVQSYVDANLISALNSNVFFLGDLTSSIALNYLAPFSPNKFFLNHDPLFSTYNVFYRKKENSPQMNYIDVYVTKLFESGISQFLRKRLKTTKLSEDKEFVLENKVYRSVESYVSQNTVYEPINFYNFYYIFIAFFAVYTSIALLLAAVSFIALLRFGCLLLLSLVTILVGRFFEMVRKIARVLMNTTSNLESGEYPEEVNGSEEVNEEKIIKEEEAECKEADCKEPIPTASK